MSFTTWYDYGFGICTSELKKEIKFDKLMDFIANAPKFEKAVKTWMECFCEDEEGSIEDIGTYDILTNYVDYACGEGGLAYIIHEVILEKEKIDLYLTCDCNDNYFLIYPPLYPWQFAKTSKKEQNLTEKKLENLFKKYLSMLTDETITIDYMTVDNFG